MYFKLGRNEYRLRKTKKEEKKEKDVKLFSLPFPHLQKYAKYSGISVDRLEVR